MSKPECPNKCKHGQVKNYKTMMLEDCNYCYPKYQGVNVMSDKLREIEHTIKCIREHMSDKKDFATINSLEHIKEVISQIQHQPKHETVEQLEELKEENTDLNISIRKVTDERDLAIEALEKIKDAWEYLKGEQSYTSMEIDNWLSYNMKPSIDNVRSAISKLKANSIGISGSILMEESK